MKIFISIASYQDKLLPVTIHSAYSAAKYKDNLTFGIVITGGGSKLKHIEDLASDIFQQDIKLGQPHSINGINDIITNPR